MDEDVGMLGAGYGLAALCPKQSIEKLIEKARTATGLVADEETPAAMIDVAKAAMDRVAEHWATMMVRH